MTRRKSNTMSVVQLLTILAVLIIGLIVAIVVFNDRPEETSPGAVPGETTEQTRPIENETDLQEAESTLEDINLEELDTSELDAAEQELL